MKISTILSDLDSTRGHREALYKYFHQNPELSLQEYKTADRIESELKTCGLTDITRIGETGLVAVISNGDGPVVAMRADIDGLPMAEQSGKDYAATGVTQMDMFTGVETPVAHTCGHDVHIVSLLGGSPSAHGPPGGLVRYFSGGVPTGRGERRWSKNHGGDGNRR